MTRLEEGIRLANSGSFDEAKGVFESILLEDPRNPEVLYNLGMCFSHLGQPDKAVVVLNKSLDTNFRPSLHPVCGALKTVLSK